MNPLPDPRKTGVVPDEPDAEPHGSAIPDAAVPGAREDAFWELDDALAHEEISRSLRNLLGDC